MHDTAVGVSTQALSGLSSVLLGAYLGTDLLGRMLTSSSTAGGIAKLFSKVAAPAMQLYSF